MLGFDTTGLLQGILGASTSLMGISVTLIALIPTLIEIVRMKSPDFFTSEESEDKLKKGLKFLGYTIGLFSTSAVFCIIDYICPNTITIIISVFTFFMGLVILIYVSYQLTSMALSFS